MDDRISQLEDQIMELRQKLAEAKRAISPEPVGSYRLKEAGGREVTLAELFGDRADLLVIHNMGRSCPYCTLWADGLNGILHHLENRAAFVVVSPDDPQTQQEYARGRGWRMRMVSNEGSDFAKDMGFEPETGKYWPGVSAFRKNEDGSIVRTNFATFGPGDNFCSLWHLFDLLADGANGWEPKYRYSNSE